MCVSEGPSAARVDVVLLPNGKQHERALVGTWTRLRKTVQQLQTKTVATVHGSTSFWRRNGRCESEESLVWTSACIESQVDAKLAENCNVFQNPCTHVSCIFMRSHMYFLCSNTGGISPDSSDSDSDDDAEVPCTAYICQIWTLVLFFTIVYDHICVLVCV